MLLNTITILCMLLCFVLFYKSKTLHKIKNKNTRRLSIVIPARNEEINLPTLLAGLENENHLIHEIIIVNDNSADKTDQIAKSFGATVINVDQHPDNWKGKTYACFVGANESTGDILLFLDADLIPQEQFIEKLLSNYTSDSVLSVQPYHYIEKFYEHMSLFFNTIAVAAVGICLPGKDKSIGLFGPVLMVDKSLYFYFGGHELVKNEVVEDYHLGIILRKKNVPCHMFLGHGSISYRMYKGGLFELIWGWSKNFASAAVKTPIVNLLPVILWLGSYYFITIELIKNIIFYFTGAGSIKISLLYLFLYIVSGVLLFIKVRKIGNFSFLSCIFYFIPLTGFTLIFGFSLVLKFIVKQVKWKDRWHKI